MVRFPLEMCVIWKHAHADIFFTHTLYTCHVRPIANYTNSRVVVKFSYAADGMSIVVPLHLETTTLWYLFYYNGCFAAGTGIVPSSSVVSLQLLYNITFIAEIQCTF